MVNIECKFCSALSVVCSIHHIDSLIDWFFRILKIWVCWCLQENFLCRHHCFKVMVKVKADLVTYFICSYTNIPLLLSFLSFKHRLSGGVGWHAFRDISSFFSLNTCLPFYSTSKCICNTLKIFLSATPTSLIAASVSTISYFFVTESSLCSMTLANEYRKCVNILVVTNLAASSSFVYDVWIVLLPADRYYNIAFNTTTFLSNL